MDLGIKRKSAIINGGSLVMGKRRAIALAKKFRKFNDLGSFVTIFCNQQASYVVGQSLVIDGSIGNTTF